MISQFPAILIFLNLDLLILVFLFCNSLILNFWTIQFVIDIYRTRPIAQLRLYTFIRFHHFACWYNCDSLLQIITVYLWFILIICINKNDLWLPPLFLRLYSFCICYSRLSFLFFAQFRLGSNNWAFLLAQIFFSPGPFFGFPPIFVVLIMIFLVCFLSKLHCLPIFLARLYSFCLPPLFLGCIHFVLVIINLELDCQTFVVIWFYFLAF